MNLYEILVPTIMNEKPIRTKYHKIWDSKVREIAKGLTVFAPVKGSWVSLSGDLFLERMIPVRIACTEEQIKQIADMTAIYYKQLCIFFYEVSANVFLKHYDPKNYKPND